MQIWPNTGEPTVGKGKQSVVVEIDAGGGRKCNVHLYYFFASHLFVCRQCRDRNGKFLPGFIGGDLTNRSSRQEEEEKQESSSGEMEEFDDDKQTNLTVDGEEHMDDQVDGQSDGQNVEITPVTPVTGSGNDYGNNYNVVIYVS